MDPPKSFTSSPSWIQYADEHNIPLPASTPAVPIAEIPSIKLDYTTSRARQLEEHAQWRDAHPLSSVGYVSTTFTVPSSSGHPLEVKISWPSAERLAKKRKEGEESKLKPPVLFTCFGGGWIQGGHTTEECWLLWPIYPVFDLIIVSVAYRLGPENQAPVWVEDCWDVLSPLLSGSFPIPQNMLNVELDPAKVLLAGSSAGAGIAAALSHRCRDASFPIYGVILNVPVLCDYHHFPLAEAQIGAPLRSYSFATQAILPSGAMKWIWDTLYSSPEDSKNSDASPLLGDVEGLPRHMVFVAGQDALCDEGVAYAKKLRGGGVEVEMRLYEGVPHVFGEMWEMEETGRWWEDLRRGLGVWLEG